MIMGVVHIYYNYKLPSSMYDVIKADNSYFFML